jgi:hypothetical protein
MGWGLMPAHLGLEKGELRGSLRPGQPALGPSALEKGSCLGEELGDSPLGAEEGEVPCQDVGLGAVGEPKHPLLALAPDERAPLPYPALGPLTGSEQCQAALVLLKARGRQTYHSHVLFHVRAN